MAQLDETLQNMLSNMEGVFGIAVIEMNSRQLAGSAQSIHNLSPATVEAIAVSAVEIIRGKAVLSIETLLAAHLKTPIENSIEDMCINTKASRIFLASINGKPDFLMVLSTKLSINMAMGWVLVRRNMPQIAAELNQ